MNRRAFVSTALGGLALPQLVSGQPAPVKLGIDLFSLRSQNWGPLELLDYAAKQQAKVVHFSEVRFIGGLEPDNLRRVRQHAEGLGIEVEIGMRSICPTSKMFDAKAGTADEQLARMIDSAVIVGSKIVRAVLGSADDRKPGPLARHIEDMVAVLRRARSKATDAGVKIAIENHAGDMQSFELKGMIEEAGRDFVGACLDSGNPLWTLEDPLVALETLYPYVLTSHVRDSAVWRVPEGAAVAWVRMGEGNVRIDEYVRQYVARCPGRALSLEEHRDRAARLRLPRPGVLGRVSRRAGVGVRTLRGDRRPGFAAPRATAPAGPGKRAPQGAGGSGSQPGIHQKVAGDIEQACIPSNSQPRYFPSRWRPASWAP